MAEADDEQTAAWRARALDAHVLGAACALPDGRRADCAAFLAEVLPATAEPAQGVAGVPEEWQDTLAWCGVPLAAGPLAWGRDVAQNDGVESPSLRDGRLELPPPETLAGLTSLSLKPMRLFIAERLGCRLQAAPGIRLWLWPGHAVLLSQSPIPLAGFFYAPPAGHRAGIALAPWGHQLVTW